MRVLLTCLSLFFACSPAYAASLSPAPVKRFDTKAKLITALSDNTVLPDGSIACATNVDACYQKQGTLLYALDPYSPEFTITFGEGASKGLQTYQQDWTATDLSTGVMNLGFYGGKTFMYAALGAGQTLDIVGAAGGLDISGDAADNEGYELVAGGIFGTSGAPVIAGTTPAGKSCATITLADVSDTDEFYVGLRRPELVNATYDNYLDLVSIGISTSAVTADIFTETIDDNAANASVDTTYNWADTETKTLCVHWTTAAVVSFSVNGTVTGTGGVTLDDGDVFVPFIRALHAAASSMGAVVVSWTPTVFE